MHSPARMNAVNAQLVDRGMIAALSDYTGWERRILLKIGLRFSVTLVRAKSESCRGCRRQANLEGTSGSRGAVETDLAAMSPYSPVRDRQAETGATIVASPGLVYPVEAIKHIREMFWWNAWTVIGDFYHDAPGAVVAHVY